MKLDPAKVVITPMPKGSRFATQEELEAYWDNLWASNTYELGPLRFLWITGEVWIHGEFVCRLSPIEADIFHILIRVYPLPLAVKDIVANLSVESVVDERDLKQYIRRLRVKIGILDIVASQWRRGYAFNPGALWVTAPDPPTD